MNLITFRGELADQIEELIKIFGKGSSTIISVCQIPGLTYVFPCKKTVSRFIATAYRTGKAAFDCFNTWKSNELDSFRKIKCLCDLTVISTNVLEFGARLIKVSPKTTLFITSVRMISEIAKIILYKGKLSEKKLAILSTALNTVSPAVDDVKDLIELDQYAKEKFDNLKYCAENLSYLIDNKDTVSFGMQKIRQVLDRLNPFVTNQKPEDNKNPQKLIDNKNPQKLMDNENQQKLIDDKFNQMLCSASNVNGRISELFVEDSVLRERICPLTTKPIWFPMVLKRTKNSGKIVMYERESIINWFKKNTNKRPSDWPQDIPFNINEIEEDISAHNLITKRLKELNDDLECDSTPSSSLDPVKKGFEGEDLVLWLLAVEEENKGNFKEALKLFESVLNIRKARLGDNHPKVGDCMRQIAINYRKQKDYKKTLEILSEELKIRKNGLGDRAPCVGEILRLKGLCYLELGDHLKSLYSFKQYLSIAKINFDYNNRTVTLALIRVADVYFKLNMFEEALEVRIEVKERLKKELGEKHPDVVKCSNDIERELRLVELATYEEYAINLYKINNISEALRVSKEVYRQRQHILGVKHPIVIKSSLLPTKIEKNLMSKK